MKGVYAFVFCTVSKGILQVVFSLFSSHCLLKEHRRKALGEAWVVLYSPEEEARLPVGFHDISIV